ncbi:WecB/TagA/CpsF family glycosyltransferase [Lutibacter sp. B2]|nr:WecB/TagA/CpsF family glycosyltransferase [Lutibacter sp. B2]
MRDRVEIMGVPIDKGNLNDARERFIRLLEEESCSTIITPNTEIVMEAQKDHKLLNVIKNADLVIPDGIGLIYASKIKRKGLTDRVTGVDLMYKVLEYCDRNSKKIYIFGGKPGVSEKATENILKKFPNINVVGNRSGYFKLEEEQEIIENINKSEPDILFTGLGAPKQEKWMDQYKSQLKVRVAMGVGGSVDIWAGTAQRAPEIYQKLGLEWLYRLKKEPWRYKRMMMLPKFMIKVLLSKEI